MKHALTAATAFLLSATLANAASVPLLPNTTDTTNELSVLNTLIGSVNGNINGPTFVTPRNLLENAAFRIQQRPSTTAATCGTTSGMTPTAYSADRWACDVNVGSGVGTLQVASATPTPPAGFSYEEKLVRASGVFTQPVCAWQEIPSSKIVPIQGQQVIFSAYIQALAGLAADNSNAATLVVIGGTGTDEGLGSSRSAVGMTASTAITPALTGLTTLNTTNVTLTTGWVRYNTGVITVPTTVTEMAVALCFTPTAVGSSATDGFAFVGPQLEVTGPNITQPTPFENKPIAQDWFDSMKTYFSIKDQAAHTILGLGSSQSTTVCDIVVQFPVPMDVAPTFAAAGAVSISGTTFKVVTAATEAAISAAAQPSTVMTANSTQFGAVAATVASGLTAGDACFLTGQSAQDARLTWSADY